MHKSEGGQMPSKELTDGRREAGNVPKSMALITEHCVKKNETKTGGQECQALMGDHGNGNGNSFGGLSKGILPFLAKEKLEAMEDQINLEDGRQWALGIGHRLENQFEFRMAPNGEGKKDECVAGSGGGRPSPMALCFDEQMGWVAKPLGPKSGH